MLYMAPPKFDKLAEGFHNNEKIEGHCAGLKIKKICFYLCTFILIFQLFLTFYNKKEKITLFLTLIIKSRMHQW